MPFRDAGKRRILLEFWVFSLSFKFFPWVLGGNLWNILFFSLKTSFIWKKWVIFLPWEFDFVIFQNVSFKFWSKKCRKEKIFAWVFFLSFRFLEFLCPWVFFGGAQKKACCMLGKIFWVSLISSSHDVEKKILLTMQCV